MCLEREEMMQKFTNRYRDEFWYEPVEGNPKKLSDSSELPVIDYLRDSSSEIKDKIVTRMVAKKLEGR